LNEEQYLEQFQLAFGSVANEEGLVAVKDARKIILDVMGEDVPPFVIDKFATLCWRVAKYGNITWENFYNLIFKASNIIRADCSTKREMPPLVQLMNKPRMHDKALGPFTATNSTNAPIVATITVTPIYSNGGQSCSGTPRTFTITVNPTPTVADQTNIAFCRGSSSSIITLSGSLVSGTTYDWSNSNTAIGLAGSGSGNIASFVTTNTTNAAINATNY
jgi:hypothetical protein